MKADLQWDVAYKMLPEEVWKMKPMGTVNHHTTILPDDRGAEPKNWTVINVAGIMFEPYIESSVLLNKKRVVVSANDESLSDKKEKSGRYNTISAMCVGKGIKRV